MYRRRTLLLLAVLLLAATAFIARPRRADPLPGFPHLMLWAWERPERLPFLDPHAAGVAFLARTIRWHDGSIESRPRLQPLSVPPETALMAVVRLESAGGPPPDARAIAREAARAAELPQVRALQIDFDTMLSEREWYRGMLQRLREDLPARVPLGITALVSWCRAGDWLGGLPVADAVPMLFRMGPGEEFDGAAFRDSLCQASAGLSTDELPREALPGRRVFLFHPRSWTPETYRGALLIARRWR